MPATKHRRGDDADAATGIGALIEQHEQTDWSAVPGVSAAEAAAWTQRLIEARERAQEGQ